MPQLNNWSQYFTNTVNSIAASFKNEWPDGVDRDKLEVIEEEINSLWLSETSTVREFQEAVGKYRMEFFKCRTKTQ